MIYCNLKGGLGNMLFQIAATKSISIDNKTECSFPNLNSHLIYLDDDNIYNRKIKHSFEYMKLFSNLPIKSINEPVNLINYPFEYHNVDINNTDTLIDGYFQSEKYFKNNEQEIRELFDFSFIPKEYIREKYNFIMTKRCTSVHVRRGDYLKYPNHHPTQSLDYYLKSVELLKNKTDLFVIFSDDIEWCKENINIKNSVYIENEKDYIELYLMSLCKHNIICNSSFSWWGAWLNINENKKVIAPKLWFGPAISENITDLIPDNWIKL